MSGPAPSAGRLDDRVYERMHDMIVSQHLPVGELVNQSRVSAELGVSRTPLRRAMARLESEGLLIRGDGGWYVQQFSSAQMASLFEIRAVLEGLGCRLAAPVIGRDRLAALEVLFEDAIAAYRDGDVRPYYQADIRFHRELLHASDDRMLISTTESRQILSNSLLRGLYRDPEETCTEHLAIIDALRARDQDLAEDLMRSHIRRAVPNILAERLIVPNQAP